MTAREFVRAVAKGETDLIQILLDILAETETRYCVIGGLAVNAYVEPVVSLDLDIVVIAGSVDMVCAKAAAQDIKIERVPLSINLTSPRSDLRIQLQSDERYQEFIPHAVEMTTLGYRMRVARLEDVLRGKVWAYQDETRRRSKRQKDLADITRVIESHPELTSLLPEPIRELVE